MLLLKLSHFLFMHAGASETVCLNMATLAWSVVTNVQGRVPLASEVLNSALYLITSHILLETLQWHHGDDVLLFGT